MVAQKEKEPGEIKRMDIVFVKQPKPTDKHVRRLVRKTSVVYVSDPDGTEMILTDRGLVRGRVIRKGSSYWAW